MLINSDKIGKAFTLIELLVTITVFSIAVTAFVNLFVYAIKFHRESLNLQYCLSNASYVTEYVSRALRMAKKDLTGGCITSKYNYENPEPEGGDFKIRFLNYDGKCQEFLKDEDELQVKKSPDEFAVNLGLGESLTPSDIIVENLKFEIDGESQTDSLQPKVTILLKLKTKESDPKELNLQTTISQRKLDVAY